MREYYQLAKPGIVYGNLFSVLAGFLFASRWSFSAGLFVATLLGVALVVASACVFNNWYDRDLDARMERTKRRALVSGAISPRAALWYGAILGIAGFTILYFFVNTPTVLAAGAGWFVYLFCYTPLKHQSSAALYVGAVAGAMPIVAGYAAGAGKSALAALVLFTLLYIWQLPHFIAIAIYRFDEYRAAGVPLLVKRPPTESQKRVARTIFFASLVLLVGGSTLIALWPVL